MTAHRLRLDDLRSRIAGADRVGSLLVSDLTNVRWLSGFTGSSGVLGVDGTSAVLFTDGRYGSQAAQQTSACGVEVDIRVAATAAGLHDLVADWCRVAALPVGFESEHVSVALHQRWTAAASVDFTATRGLVEAGRRSKHDAEVASIEAACRIADRALADIAPHITAGVTEADVRNMLEARMRDYGAAGPSYETIVAAGPRNAALPHHRPTQRPLADGDTVIIDVGALVEGYHSDMTRTFVVGEPTQEQVDAYGLVLESQLAGLAAVGPGVPARQVDEACRSVIERAGRGEWFSHGTGHGVGLLIHEEPYLNRVSEAVLQPGDVVTVEPGVYREGFGGVRIEDLVLVTADGSRRLTASPKDSLCLPSPPTT
ncbi:MAG: M24 family metallopeptidase [Ilumatobacteraceae bacterium]